MDVLPNALPEKFFAEASQECLDALVPLVDLGIAKHFQKYCTELNYNAGVANIIQRNFGDAIMRATYHQTLHDSGIVRRLKELNLDAVGAMRDVGEMESMVKDLEAVIDNFQFIKATIPPRSKEDYEKFYSLAPDEFQRGIAANRDYFYYPRAAEVSTGLGYLISHKPDYEIALKGLRTRLAFAKSGGAWSEGVKKL